MGYCNTVIITEGNIILFCFRDRDGLQKEYTPIAVIYHRVTLLSGPSENKKVPIVGETRGHYMVDVKTVEGKWVHTDDGKIPKEINRVNVSKQGTLILYKQV